MCTPCVGECSPSPPHTRTQYWQSAVAATPAASWKGYILGGLCWFSIPFTLATSLGLAANALSLPVSPAEADDGLVPAAVAVYLMGSSGASLILVMLFMAVTSAASGEQIAVSSIIAFDVYRTYVNPGASGTQIVKVSRWAILIVGLLMGPIAVALNHMGISLGWLYLFMGVLIGAAVFPVAFAISWLRCSAGAAIGGAVGGTVLGLCAWLAAGAGAGGLTLATLGRDDVMLVGNLVSLLSSGAIAGLWAWRFPVAHTWQATTHTIALVEHDPNAFPSPTLLAELDAAWRKIVAWGVSLAILFVVVWPLLTLAAGTFSPSFFTFWVVLSVVWGLVATAILVLLPLWEYRTALVSSYDIIRRAAFSVHGEVKEGPQGLIELEAVRIPTQDSCGGAVDDGELLGVGQGAGVIDARPLSIQGKQGV